MIDPLGTLHNRAAAEASVSSSGRSQLPRCQSFAAQLSNELSGTNTALPAAGVSASLPQGQQSVAGQIPSGTTSPPSGLNGLVIAFPSTASSAAASKPAEGTEAPLQTPVSFDDAYWAAQPAAVQQLQNIQNPTQRTEVATQLAQEGYTIDVPIMVWGWDPAATTAAREAMGYTWVPSALQPPVEVAPGLTFAGSSYNPAVAPAGSITV
jgi:hypothetical protein